MLLSQLRHGTAAASLGADDDLMKVVDALRAKRPDIKVHVRGDAGFGVPLMYDVFSSFLAMNPCMAPRPTDVARKNHWL